MLISWDIGKRCNLDCTYCQATRHNNFSPHASLESLIKTFKFAKQWAEIYNSHRIDVPDAIEMNFTGGEPTTNPDFWKLIEYIAQDEKTYWLGLTTNGTWGRSQANNILKHFGAITVSFHCEADKKIRDSVLENIIELKNNGIHVQVNVMLHTDLWNIAMDACEYLDKHGVFYNPVPIGDGPADDSQWKLDANGTLRRTSHVYTAEQQKWFFNKMNISADVAEQVIGNKMGRACCGGRCLVGKVDNEWKEVKLVNTEFKDWYCTVDWFFLHIDQELGKVYHHQTCQATHQGTRGEIGTLDNTEKLISDLKLRLSKDSFTPIVCPNSRCGCGMCVPKAKDMNDFKELWQAIINVPVREK